MHATTRSAVATRIDGNLYDVTYPGRGMDKGVPYRYLRLLARDGYEVRICDLRYQEFDGHVVVAV